MHGWPSARTEEIQPHWSFRDEIAIIDRIVMQGRIIIIPAYLQKRPLEQLHINHVGIEKTRSMQIHLLDQHQC